MSLLKKTADVFMEKVDTATEKLWEKWKIREEVDVKDLLLDVLFFRNSNIFKSIRILIDNKQFNSIEILLRSLSEGIVTFEWCMINPKERGFRFRKTCVENTLEIADIGLQFINSKTRKIYQGVLEEYKEQGYKNIPNIRQMIEEISENKQISSNQVYAMYKKLSKILHGKYENWTKYYPEKVDDPLFERNPKRAEELIWMIQIAALLQVRNIELVGSWDEYLKFEELTELTKYYNQTEISLILE